MKYAILMPHGVDLLRCLERVRSAQNTEESTSCTLSIKIEPDSRGLVPAIHVFSHRSKDVDARLKAGHDEFMEGSSPYAIALRKRGEGKCRPFMVRTTP